MYFRTETEISTGDFWEQTGRVGRALAECDWVLIGAGAGLSASAGFDYAGDRFRVNFGDFEDRYGFHDMYSGGFYPYPTPEEYWGYWSRLIWLNRYQSAPRPVYERLLKLVEGKDCFVLTTNVDHCFQKAGFDKKRLFYTQGDYGLFQCSEPCCRETWDNETVIREMVEEQEGMRIPSRLLPTCPHCGKPLVMNLRCDDSFVEDEGWHAAAGRYEEFLRRHAGRKGVLLELGVGYNTPGIIKYPFWRMAAERKDALYVCVNRGEGFCPEEIRDRAICVDGDLGEVLLAL